MHLKRYAYAKMLLTLLLVIGLLTLSIKPQTQDLSAITPASQLTLQGQSDQGQLEQPEEITASPEPIQPEEQAPSTSEPSKPKLAQQTEPNKSISTSEPVAQQDEPPVTLDDSNHLEITEEAEGGEAFFTVNLQNNQIVTEPAYTVVLTHLDPSLTVQSTSVTLNDEVLSDFQGELLFIEGPNTVTFNVAYTDSNGDSKTARQTYQITLDTQNIVIQTTAKSENVTEPTYRFSANAMLGNKTVPLEVTLNGEKIKPLAGHAYIITLQLGDNQLVFSATDGTNTSELTAAIHFKGEQSNLTLETDLVDQKVAISTFSFSAKALYGETEVPVSVTLNDTALPAQTVFTVELEHGTNTIQLQTSYEGEQLTKQYKILYSDPTIVETKPVDEFAPKLKTDLISGTHVKGLIKTINVWPTTAQGERIRGKNVAVKVNGVGIPFVWDDSEKTSYKLTLQDGENTVEIRAWDNEGRIVKESFTVTAEDLQNGIIGQATISVEASVLGIPYLIPPTKMDIHQGEKGSYIVDQLLRQHGFSYVNTGTLDTNFYLAALKKPNMLSAVAIPDDLWTLVEAASTRAFRDDYRTDSLGEFDFANGSGWMFSINGDYPNYGLSDAYFLDGDVVRIRYTLHYGLDIGGAGGNGNSANSNWNKEW